MSAENDATNEAKGPEQLLNEAESLIWAMLDDHIEDADLSRLTTMLEGHGDVRARYIDCVQLHVDLNEHFSRQAADQKAAPCVLPNLTPNASGIQGFPPVHQ
jgi:hypothetical protein